ncbi:MAG: hypothetical protein PHQ35_02770 [Phycisphaerae bacterium]|nr:hypothetical protein [Phycisphaerae bacterium]MDD5380784.1 hypothetical protein [Phycisphaerae bacterium]
MKNAATAPAATRISARIVTKRLALVKAGVSRKYAKNATVRETAYQNATRPIAKLVWTANVYHLAILLIAKNATVRETAYQNAERVMNAVMAHASRNVNF